MVTPSPTGAPGTYLRSLREERAVSLEDIAHATRLSVHQLESLEAGEFQELPAPVFVKGFIRAYCHFLGVTPDEALARYGDAVGLPATSARGAPSMRPAPAWGASPIAISVVLLLVFGGGLLALKLASKPVPTASTRPVAPSVGAGAMAPPPAVVAPSEAPAASTRRAPDVSTPSAATPPRTGQSVHRLGAKATEPTWLRVQIDDGQTIEELLPVGATREWTAARRFLITVGNAGGIELTLNGRQLPSLGSRGAVIRGLELPQSTAAAGS